MVLGTGDLLTVMPEQTTYYTARLQYTACNGDYFDIINTCHVTVNNETPELEVRVSEDTVCPQQQVTVSAITTDALTYQWNTGDSTDRLNHQCLTHFTNYLHRYCQCRRLLQCNCFLCG